MATFRSTDTDPKEIFVHHAAGFGGFGGSSYIDAVVCRDRDESSGWTSAADATPESRRYIGQSWRADVNVVWDSTGHVVEWMRYTPYGEAVTLPWINADFNRSGGSPDGGDYSAFTTAYSAHSASADMDRSGGTPDSADFTAYDDAWNNGDAPMDGYVGGYSHLTVGYAGYRWRAEAGGYQVRHRFYSPELGRWASRDPVGYIESINSYSYVRENPTRKTDALGLRGGACNAISCGGPNSPVDPAITPGRPFEYPGSRFPHCIDFGNGTVCLGDSCNGRSIPSYLNHPAIRSTLDRIFSCRPTDGETPSTRPILISCYDNNCDGSDTPYPREPMGPDTIICGKDPYLLRHALIHELTHVAQQCEQKRKFYSSCSAAILVELEAYAAEERVEPPEDPHNPNRGWQRYCSDACRSAAAGSGKGPCGALTLAQCVSLCQSLTFLNTPFDTPVDVPVPDSPRILPGPPATVIVGPGGGIGGF